MSSKRKAPRRLLSVLGVSVLAALGLMAVVASGAQAAQWTIGGQTLPELKIEHETFESSGGPITINSEYGGVTWISCEAQQGLGVIYDAGYSKWEDELSGCRLGGENETCQLSEDDETILISTTGDLSGDGTYDIFSPQSGGVFTEFTVESVEGEECTLIPVASESHTFELVGQIGGEVGSAGTSLPLSFSAAIEEATESAQLSEGLGIGYYGNISAYADGGNSMSLTGANAGQPLGVQ